MRIPEKLLNVFKKEECFLIASHISPDGDAIGSSVALGRALESLGKKVFVYNRDSVPKNYRFIPGHERVRSDFKKFLAYDPVLVLLDCNSPERAGLEKLSFRRAIVVDHHQTESDFGEVRWIDRNAAATGLMVYRILKRLKAAVTPEIAMNLYTAIAVDTGTFRYSNTSSEVLRASAELIDAGAEAGRIAVELYETWERKRFSLLVMTLNTLEIQKDIAIVSVTLEMFRKTGTKPEDTETFSNFARVIDSVKISALFREIRRGEWKASLRSKGEADVAKIAESFGGGGHKNAAGFRIKGDYETAREAFLKAARKILR